ncbi:MAG: phage head-tail connector protein [Bacillota bacterium]|nr:phage head-tail connector protein [Bacillota bacterium]
MEGRLEALKTLIGESGSEKDALLMQIITMVESQILDYINHESLPSALESVLLLICVEYYKSSYQQADKVASITRGDVSISYDKGGSGLVSSSGDGFFGWKTMLNSYRRLRK